jgi:hypothetical protein
VTVLIIVDDEGLSIITTWPHSAIPQVTIAKQASSCYYITAWDDDRLGVGRGSALAEHCDRMQRSYVCYSAPEPMIWGCTRKPKNEAFWFEKFLSETGDKMEIS